MKQAICPTCGAQVSFRSAASIMAVCDYCRSTLIRHDTEIENIGTMAELLEDASPIQIGSEGRYRGTHFTVVGRIQLQYAQGVWNEWHLLFDNQKSGWLGEANGSFTVTFLVSPRETLPAFNALSPGESLTIGGEPFTVTDIENSKCIAGAGELPFKVGAGYEAPTIDLRSADNYATIDYSENPPMLFLGASVKLADLHLTNLRDAAEIGVGKVKARAFQCPSCGGTVEIRTPDIQSVTCGSCHALLSADNDKLKILHKFAKNLKISPRIPLGSEGRFDNTSYRVIGYLARRTSSGGMSYAGWDEYLLHNPTQGFCWLTEYQGHWNLAWPTHAAPAKSHAQGGHAGMRYEGRLFRHFEKTQAKTSYVLGEFYWRVSVNDTVTLNDYIDPPYILSEEKSGKEITWTVGEYVSPEFVQQAFSLQIPLQDPRGVAPNQPWPHESRARHVWWSFWGATLMVLTIQMVSLMQADNRTIYSNHFDFPSLGSEPQTTTEFDVPGHTGNLRFITSANVDNAWADFNMALINKDTGKTYTLSREVSYYHGYDDGYWSEGSGNDEALIADVPPGHYLLQLEAENGGNFGHPLGIYLEIRRNTPNWHNFFVIEALMLLFPLIYWWRRATFEAERWSGGDYPQQTPGEKILSALDNGDD